MLVIAMLTICSAHILRVLRQELFICTYEKPDRRNLVQALSIGYFANYFLPFKLGDLMRSWIAGRKMKNGYGFALATVIIDRLLDVVVVGIIFGLLSLHTGGGHKNSESITFYTILSAIVIISIIIGWYGRTYVKKFFKLFASLFNRNIEFRILKFCWSLIWGFTDIIKRISKLKMIMSTVIMWSLYLSSYYCFAIFLSKQGISVRWVDIFYMLFAKDSMHVGSLGLVTGWQELFSTQLPWLALYLLLPNAILYIISLLMKKKQSVSENDEKSYLNLLPHMDKDERLNFLKVYFSSEQSSYVQNYLKINQNVLIMRDYSAGSNATTMLCMDKGIQFFRKYAFGADGHKLYEQIEWLLRFKDMVPLPQILNYIKEKEYCYYDMPYSSNAVGLFEYAHSMPKEKAWNFVRRALECLESTIYKTNVRVADIPTINSYISNKVEKNFEKITNAKYLKHLMEFDEIVINGENFHNLPYYRKYINREYLQKIFQHDSYSEIHGDLTIENIICTKDSEGKDDFYIIDPNTSNVHDSSNLDYAKLLQSLHGGYEFLMATKNVEVEKNHINFIFTKSDAYCYLYQMLDDYINNNFEQERVRSIFFHEIIHWLRLMPYKIEKNGKRVLLFYAGMLMVMNDVIKRFEEV